ncbi:hypothetical protein KY342_03225 [Candidatus Woesearchaeota archaeon]|nr:hypothetical protein [Candidatus Woesearchaeota archaeon]
MKKRLLLLSLFLLLIPVVTAMHGEMTLLAVKETEEGLKGNTADLYLDIVSGKGRVFLETFPLSKLDTQISTRFAKEIACDYIDKNCDKYDFFYTIKSDSSIIGGPSASGAIAVLTVSVLEGIEIDENVAMTGTINSGGLIGPVGGLKEKIDAAARIGIKRVVVPKGEILVTDSENITIDLREYASNKSIQLFEVADLTESIYIFSGKQLKEEKGELVVDEVYLDVMQGLAIKLCDRSLELKTQLGEMKERGPDIIEAKEKAENFTEKGKNAFEQGKYYSAASYCFGANTRYRFLLLKIEGERDFEALKKEIEEYDKEIDKLEIKTIPDLEAYMVIKERLREARDSLNKSIGLYYEYDPDYIENLAYAIERIYTAHSWAEFIGVKGKVFVFDRESLKDSCLKKLSEVEERYQYVKLLFNEELEGIKKESDYAYADFESGNYELCLFRASKVKAEVDTILSMVGVKEEQLDNILDNKLKVVKDNIIEQQENGIFPILGYSYYEYANSLKDEKYSALLYSGYALELSNLDIYFKEKSIRVVELIKELNGKDIDNKIIIVFIVGLILGILIGLSFYYRKKKKK